MKRWLVRFNIILSVAILTAVGPACKSTEKEPKKPYSHLRLHLETQSDASGRSKQVQVFRQHPSTVTIEKNPFLTEQSVKSAEVVDAVGGFSVVIQFNREGSWILEQYTSANRNRSLAVFAGFGAKQGDEPKVSRWIAAPKIVQRITDGKLVFTPDADREEADSLVIGLNNAAKKAAGIDPE